MLWQLVLTIRPVVGGWEEAPEKVAGSLHVEADTFEKAMEKAHKAAPGIINEGVRRVDMLDAPHRRQ